MKTNIATNQEQATRLLRCGVSANIPQRRSRWICKPSVAMFVSLLIRGSCHNTAPDIRAMDWNRYGYFHLFRHVLHILESVGCLSMGSWQDS